jgi:hypothetical protein
MDDEMRERRILARIKEYVSDVHRDFPTEHMGVGDKLLLGKIVRKNALLFIQAEESTRHFAFVCAVREDMERIFGYKSNHNHRGYY